MKDIFVDTSAAQQFCNPINEFYKGLLEWLNKEGYLVYTNKLLMEIGRGNQNLLLIIDKLIKDGRANKISNNQLKTFTFKKKETSSFVSNKADWDHIKTVVLSNRKIAIAVDINLNADINLMPVTDGVQPAAYSCPSECPYK